MTKRKTKTDENWFDEETIQDVRDNIGLARKIYNSHFPKNKIKIIKTKIGDKHS